MTTERRFTIHLLPEPEGGFTVRVPALPEAITCGDSVEEAMANGREVIELVLDFYRDEGRKIPEDIETRVEHLTIAA